MICTLKSESPQRQCSRTIESPIKTLNLIKGKDFSQSQTFVELAFDPGNLYFLLLCLVTEQETYAVFAFIQNKNPVHHYIHRTNLFRETLKVMKTL